MFKRIPRIALGATLVVAPLGLAANADAAVAETKSSASASALIKDCIDVTNQDVGRGSTGDYVREVQCLLNWAVSPNTYHLIAVDGQFGPDTEGKVIQFQRCAKLVNDPNLKIDGRVGPQTAPLLEKWADDDLYVC